MSTKHTPGPWDFYTEPQPNGCPIVGARGLMVAMLAHSINHEAQREAALANARLIAAAPELLAFAQEFLNDYQSEDGLASMKHYAGLAHAAIAKATGEAA